MVLIPGIAEIPICPRCGKPAQLINLANAQPPPRPSDAGAFAMCARDSVYWMVAPAPQFWAGLPISGPSPARQCELLLRRP